MYCRPDTDLHRFCCREFEVNDQRVSVQMMFDPRAHRDYSLLTAHINTYIGRWVPVIDNEHGVDQRTLRGAGDPYRDRTVLSTTQPVNEKCALSRVVLHHTGIWLRSYRVRWRKPRPGQRQQIRSIATCQSA